MLDEAKVKKAINCILNGCTISEAKKETGFSERTIQNYITALNKETSNVYNPLLYKKVRLQQEKISRERNRLGGRVSTYSSKMTMEERIEIAKSIIANSFTLEEASIYFNIPSSTLYDYLISINDKEILSELQMVFDYHKQTAFNHKINK